jgi:hypothetical protein
MSINVGLDKQDWLVETCLVSHASSFGNMMIAIRTQLAMAIVQRFDDQDQIFFFQRSLVLLVKNQHRIQSSHASSFMSTFMCTMIASSRWQIFCLISESPLVGDLREHVISQLPLHALPSSDTSRFVSVLQSQLQILRESSEKGCNTMEHSSEAICYWCAVIKNSKYWKEVPTVSALIETFTSDRSIGSMLVRQVSTLCRQLDLSTANVRSFLSLSTLLKLASLQHAIYCQISLLFLHRIPKGVQVILHQCTISLVSSLRVQFQQATKSIEADKDVLSNLLSTGLTCFFAFLKCLWWSDGTTTISKVRY